MITYKVKRKCFALGRLYERDELVEFENSVKVPEHFEFMGETVTPKVEDTLMVNDSLTSSSLRDKYEAMTFNDVKELGKKFGIKLFQKSKEELIEELLELSQG